MSGLINKKYEGGTDDEKYKYLSEEEQKNALEKLHEDEKRINAEINTLLGIQHDNKVELKKAELKEMLGFSKLEDLGEWRGCYIGTKETQQGSIKKVVSYNGSHIVNHLRGETFKEIKPYKHFFDVVLTDGKHQLLLGVNGDVVLEGDVSLANQGNFYPHCKEAFPTDAKPPLNKRRISVDYYGSEDMYLLVEQNGKKNIAHIPAWEDNKGDLRGSLVSDIWFDDVPTDGYNANPLPSNQSLHDLVHVSGMIFREVIIGGKKKIFNLRTKEILDSLPVNIPPNVHPVAKDSFNQKDGYLSLKDAPDSMKRFEYKEISGKKILVRLGLKDVVLRLEVHQKKGFLSNKFFLVITDSSKKTLGTVERGSSFTVQRDSLDSTNTQISRNHCQIFFSNDQQVTVLDLGSTNGTYVKIEE